MGVFQYNMYSSPNIIMKIKSRKMRWIKQVAHMGQVRYAYNALVRKLKERSYLELHRSEYNTKMALKEIG
jgi:hypothetical protein